MFQVTIFRPVEPPMNDSNFCRRLRASIGMVEEFSRKAAGSKSKENLDDVEESDEEYVCETVVAKCKKPTDNDKIRIIELEAENKRLLEELRSIEDKTRKEMAEKFGAILAQQASNYKYVNYCIILNIIL